MNYIKDIVLKLNKSFDESSDNANILNDSLFEECFKKIFVEKKLDDEFSEEEHEYCGNEKRKQNLFNFEFYKEKSTPETNSLNSNENNSGKIANKSKELSKNCIEKNDFCKLSSIGHSDESKNNNSINIIINTNEGNNCNIENNVNNIIKQNYTKESNIDNYSISFLGRKRSLFKVIYPKDYVIFNCEDLNSNSRQTINVIFNRLYEYRCKNLKINSNFVLDESPNLKKSHKKKLNLEKRRKKHSDNIRKKVKSRFLKALKNIINQKLKLAGSKELFSFLPQVYIRNMSINKNRDVLDLTFKEIYSKNFFEDEKANESDIKNYKHNLTVLEYLEKNKEIAEKSNYNVFKNMKFYQIFNEYLRSREFEKEVTSLKMQKEKDKYIRNYIIKAGSFIEFYSL
jgi:hypothetical protein